MNDRSTGSLPPRTLALVDAPTTPRAIPTDVRPHPTDPLLWQVLSRSRGHLGRWHTVNFFAGTCTCEAFTYRAACPHLARIGTMPIADLLSTLTGVTEARVAGVIQPAQPPAFVCVNCGCQAAGLADGLCPRCVNRPAPLPASAFRDSWDDQDEAHTLTEPHAVCPGCGAPALPSEVYCAKTPYGRPWCARRALGALPPASSTTTPELPPAPARRSNGMRSLQDGYDTAWKDGAR